MCGIAGIVENFENKSNYDTVLTMRDKMINRGPNSKGINVMGDAIFGFRRLSILDLSDDGNQPMVDYQNHNMIVFNGEIYNHNELRRTLIKKGYVFRSRTDTECILYGYNEWGLKLPNYCRGMWAWAIWDHKKNKLILSRDRLGQKPLFYYYNRKKLSFASNLGALEPSMEKKYISDEGVKSLLSYQYIPETESIYKDVFKVGPGQILVYQNKKIKKIKYWDFNFNNSTYSSNKGVVDDFESIISSAIDEQLIADVEVGLFLSGGIDSGLISSISAKKYKGIKAITATFPKDPNLDEQLIAKSIAKKHNIKHYSIPFSNNLIGYLPEIFKYNEPLAEASILPLCNLSKFAKNEISVVLTGDGGDEAFDGYGLARYANAAESNSKNNFYKALRLFSKFFNFIDNFKSLPYLRRLRSINSLFYQPAISGLENWISKNDQITRDLEGLIFGKSLNENEFSRGYYLKKILQNSEFEHWWQAALLVGVKGRLANDYLMKVDIATMHSSIEARSPLMDHRIFDLVSKLNFDQLLTSNHSKPILRNIAKKHLDASIVNAKKKGFSLPIVKSFTSNWKNILEKVVYDGVAVQCDLISQDGIKKIIKMHGVKPYQKFHKLLFSILVLEIWLRVFHENHEVDSLISHGIIPNK